MVASRFVSHYEILRQLGRGKMSEVYLARDHSLPRRVALKFLPESLELDELARQRLLREARSAAALDHAYICKIYEIGEDRGQYYIAMEFVEGETLRERLKKGGVDFEDTLRIALEITEALKAAHDKDIVHRDLKPENIMLAADNHIKLVDFGLALRVPSAEIGSQESTPARHSARAGTLAYMSPEQLLGTGVDTRSDIFSLGLIVHELLSGRHPYRRATSRATAMAILNEPPPRLASDPNKFPEDLSRLVDRMLAKEPSQRYASVGEVQERLRSVQRQTGGFAERRDDGKDWRFLARLILLLVALVLAYLGLEPVVKHWLGQDISQATMDLQVVPHTEYLSSDDDYRLSREARISPNGEWVSLLYEDGGPRGIEIHRWKERDIRAIATDLGSLLSHVVSPDGRRIAYLVRRDGKTELHQLSSLDPRGLESLTRTEVPFHRLVRWIGDHIYAESFEVDPTGQFSEVDLWRFDTRDQTRHKIPIEGAELGPARDFDIRPDEQMVVFSAVGENLDEDIWIADLTGARLSRLTGDPWQDVHPRWVRRVGQWEVVYVSNRQKQSDLWRIRLNDRFRQQLTHHPSRETNLDSSLDGKYLFFRTVTDRADLWSLDLGTMQPEQITISLLRPTVLRDPGEVMSNYSPAISPQRALIAFQRIAGAPDVSSEILLGQLHLPRVEKVESLIEEGFAPRLSHDGRWLSYLKFIDGLMPELWIREIATGKKDLISTHASVSSYYTPPQPWSVADNMSWSASRADLYFVEPTEAGRCHLKRLRAEEGLMPELVVSEADPGIQLLEPAPHSDNSRLAYVSQEYLEGETIWKLWLRDLNSRQSRTLLVDRSSDHFDCLGWWNNSVLVLRGHSNSDNSQRLELLRVTASQDVHQLMTFQKAYAQTAVLAPTGHLYLTVARGGIPNIAQISLKSGQLRFLTSNQSIEANFGGLQPSAKGLIFSRQTSETRFGRITF